MSAAFGAERLLDEVPSCFEAQASLMECLVYA